MVIDGLAQLLEDRGVATWDPTGAAYTGNGPVIVDTAVPANPPRLIVLSLYPGDDSSGEESRNPWRTPRLQVRTRGDRDPRTARDLDQQVHDVLHGLATVLPDGTNLTDCYSLQSAPLPMGQDATGRWELSRNYQLTIET